MDKKEKKVEEVTKTEEEVDKEQIREFLKKDELYPFLSK